MWNPALDKAPCHSTSKPLLSTYTEKPNSPSRTALSGAALLQGSWPTLCFPQEGTNESPGVSAGKGGGEGTLPAACLFREPSAQKQNKHLLQSLVTTANISDIVLLVKYHLYKSNLWAIFCSLVNEVQTGLTPNFSGTAGKLERKRHCAHKRGSREQPDTSSRLTFLNSVCLCFLRPVGNHCWQSPSHWIPYQSVGRFKIFPI